jgi:UDP-glucose 4-epimerase
LGKIGEENNNKSTNLFPILEKVVTGELEKISIFGRDYPTIDGTCVRDYIHIMDLSNAHFAALKYLQKNRNNFISLNIGTGKGLSVLEVIKAYSKINEIFIPYDFIGRRQGDASFLVADNSKALNLLSWKPVKSLEDICVDSFRYLKNKLSNN